MRKKPVASAEFGETLLSAAAAVGQSKGAVRLANREASEDDSVERQARVEALRRQVADENYPVDAAAVARRVVDEHLV